MLPESQTVFLSLSFMWVFTTVFGMAVYLCYRRTGYVYLRFGVLALGLELLRLIVNSAILAYPVAPLYFASSALLFAESLACLQMLATQRNQPFGWGFLIGASAVYVLSLVANTFTFDPYVRWTWYVTYSPIIGLHALIVAILISPLAKGVRGVGWLVAAALASIATRTALPWFSVEVGVSFGFIYFVDGLVFTLMVASIMLLALEQLLAERTESLDRQRQAESTLRFLVDNTEDVILSHDHDGTLLSWNDRARAMFGLTEHETVAKRRIDSLLLPTEAGPPSARAEYLAITPEGRRLPVEVSRRHAAVGERATYTLVIRDLSAFKEVEAKQEAISEQIQEVQKLESLGIFAAGLAHDFNNLLASIMGHAELAIKQLGAPQEARKALDQIVTASGRASELTDQMLTYAGKGEFHPKLTDLNEIIEETFRLMRTTVSPRTSLTLDLTPGGAWIEGDQAQLTQVMINLIANAADALEGREGTIRVTTTRRNGTISLQVRDNGIGMPEEVRRRVFEPFYSTKFAGRGLGLAAVAGILRRHHAEVEVDSNPGAYTEFQVTFAAWTGKHPTPELVAEVQQRVNDKALHVLIVDDQRDLLNLCDRILATAGHRTTTASNGTSAIEKATAAADFDLAIIDYNLTDMTGPRVYKLLQEAGMSIPVIFMSGFDAARVRAEIEPGWIGSVLKKPFMADDLLDAIVDVIDRETQDSGRART